MGSVGEAQAAAGPGLQAGQVSGALLCGRLPARVGGASLGASLAFVRAHRLLSTVGIVCVQAPGHRAQAARRRRAAPAPGAGGPPPARLAPAGRPGVAPREHHRVRSVLGRVWRVLEALREGRVWVGRGAEAPSPSKRRRLHFGVLGGALSESLQHLCVPRRAAVRCRAALCAREARALRRGEAAGARAPARHAARCPPARPLARRLRGACLQVPRRRGAGQGGAALAPAGRH